MIEHDITKQNNFIGAWFLDDLELCENLILFHKLNKNKGEGHIFLNGEYTIDKKIKDSIDCDLRENEELTCEYVNNLQKCVEKYIEKYPKCNEYSKWTIIDAINIQHYPPNGGYFLWHTERANTLFPNTTRHLVFITYLNDVDDAGETEFYHQKLKIKPRKGLTVIFPADWTFTHRGIASPTQEKYIVTGWFNYI